MSEDDDLVPISVRLGEVVPPEDPEDWTRPLTWAAAIGMLLGPLVALLWFAFAAPHTADRVLPGTLLLAVAVACGAVATGSTQQGWLRTATATAAAALFAALVTIVVGAATAGERQVGVASPTLAHAFGAAVAGLGGAVAAAPVAARLATAPSRLLRLAVPAAIAGAVAILLLPLLYGASPV